MKKQYSPFKTCMFCLLILIASMGLQIGLCYLTEGFSKITTLVSLLGCFCATYVFKKFYDKKFWVNIIWICILGFILNVVGIMFGEAIIIASGVEDLSVWGAFVQILCAIFSPNNLSNIIVDKANFIDAVLDDFGSACLFALLGVLFTIFVWIGKGVREKKHLMQHAPFEETKKEFEEANITLKPQIEQQKTEEELTVICKKIIVVLSKHVENYNKNRNKEEFIQQLSMFDVEYLQPLSSQEKTALTQLATKYVQSKNPILAKSCKYILKRI